MRITTALLAASLPASLTTTCPPLLPIKEYTLLMGGVCPQNNAHAALTSIDLEVMASIDTSCDSTLKDGSGNNIVLTEHKMIDSTNAILFTDCAQNPLGILMATSQEIILYDTQNSPLGSLQRTDENTIDFFTTAGSHIARATKNVEPARCIATWSITYSLNLSDPLTPLLPSMFPVMVAMIQASGPNFINPCPSTWINTLITGAIITVVIGTCVGVAFWACKRCAQRTTYQQVV